MGGRRALPQQYTCPWAALTHEDWPPAAQTASAGHALRSPPWIATYRQRERRERKTGMNEGGDAERKDRRRAHFGPLLRCSLRCSAVRFACWRCARLSRAEFVLRLLVAQAAVGAVACGEGK